MSETENKELEARRDRAKKELVKFYIAIRQYDKGLISEAAMDRVEECLLASLAGPQDARIKELEAENAELKQENELLKSQLVAVLPNLCEAAYVLLVAHDSDCDNYEGMGISATRAYEYLRDHGCGTARIDAILHGCNRGYELTKAWKG